MRDDLILWNGEATALGEWTSAAADGSSAALSVEPGPRGLATPMRVGGRRRK
jgi:hypothetical protein